MNIRWSACAARLRPLFVAIGALLGAAASHGQGVRVFDPIFQDHAVLQRDRPIVLRGRAQPHEVVTLSLGQASEQTRADASGRWSASLPALPAGGPHTVLAIGNAGSRQALRDVLIGDVYLCSGQSNMEWPVKDSTGARVAIERAAAGPPISLLAVPKASSAKPEATFQAALEWQLAAPSTVPNWSAVCYFFAHELQASVPVPIGLIQAAWSGSNIRPWLSSAGLRALGDDDAALETLGLFATDPAAGQQQFGRRWQAWWRDKAREASPAPWELGRFNPDGWRVAPPGLGDYQAWGIADLARFNGMLWFRTTLGLSAAQAAQTATLDLGGVDEIDQTWLNGHILGNTFGYGTERSYPVPAGVLRAGENTLVVNVLNTYASGGLVGDNGKRRLRLASGEVLALNGTWHYRAVAREIGNPPRAPWESAGGLSTLYNAMIVPLGPLGLRGVLWYQGESNAGESAGYHALLTQLMIDWRRQFGANLPFLIVQLPNFCSGVTVPAESGWASLREAQRRVVARDGNAGLAVTIDLGEPGNLHPPGKQGVGYRLARAARQLIHGQAIAPSGPVAGAARREGPDVALRFDDVEQGLIASGAQGLTGFELCGDAPGSCRFVAARIDGRRVLLSSPDASSATRVRYAWADSPATSLFDRSGMPAGPFELRIDPPLPTSAPVTPARADLPAARGDANSMLVHQQLLAKRGQGRIDAYFLGDSITRRWGASDVAYQPLLAHWRSTFFGWNAGNFGWGGDQTQNVLWRLTEGELDGVNPKLIVLMAGTNNVGQSVPGLDDDATAAAISDGIREIIRVCRQKAPGAHIVLMGILPRNDNLAYLPIIDKVNARIARLADGNRLRYLNINHRMADDRGRLFDGMTDPDQLHLAIKGYRVWADALKPIFTELLGPPAAVDLAPPPTGDPSAAGPR